MKRFAIPILALLALVGSAFASEPTANDLLTKANIAATSEHKQILVIFHASWCGWCKKLDEFLADPQMGKLMTDNFVIVHVDVMENGDKKAIENAGGEDLMKQWNGEKAGLPFMVIQNASGKIVADSNLTGKDG